MSADTQLATVPPKESALAIFCAPDGLEPWLQQVRAKVDEFQKILPDLTTKKGRDAYASMSFQIAKSKTALEAVGKEISAQQKEIPKKIDAERKRVWDILESWQKEVRKPLDDWEAADIARRDGHTDRIQAMKDAVELTGPMDAAQIKAAIQEMEARVIDDSWEEFLAEAAQVKDQCLAAMRRHLKAREVYEAEQAELARLRAEAEARAKADHEAAIAREAAEKARIEAEQEAQAEREAAAQREQALIDQAAQVKREAEQQARDAEAAAANQALQLQLAAEQAERQKIQAEADRVAAIQRAEQERVAAEQRQAEAVEQARLAEIARQEAAAAEEKRQADAREADKAHKGAIYKESKEAFMQNGMTEDCARLAVKLIASNMIPNIKITY